MFPFPPCFSPEMHLLICAMLGTFGPGGFCFKHNVGFIHPPITSFLTLHCMARSSSLRNRCFRCQNSEIQNFGSAQPVQNLGIFYFWFLFHCFCIFLFHFYCVFMSVCFGFILLSLCFHYVLHFIMFAALSQLFCRFSRCWGFGRNTLDAEALHVVEALHKMPVALDDVWVAEPAERLHLLKVVLRVGSASRVLAAEWNEMQTKWR